MTAPNDLYAVHIMKTKSGICKAIVWQQSFVTRKLSDDTVEAEEAFHLKKTALICLSDVFRKTHFSLNLSKKVLKLLILKFYK